jgi:hypothetical protein
MQAQESSDSKEALAVRLANAEAALHKREQQKEEASHLQDALSKVCA